MSVLKDHFSRLPEDLKKKLTDFSLQLKKAGYKCYLVGGSCRDLLLGKEPEDYDFASDAPIDEVFKLFRKVIPTGVDHGTVTILYKGLQIELTRFRKDISTDGRRAVVEFTDQISEDQERRDLRLNALAYDLVDDQLVDSQNGLDDLKEKKLRFVGEAKQRVIEDHLRAIRYGRFILSLNDLNFSYDQKELNSVIETFDPSHLSIERIREEFSKIFKIKFISPDFIKLFFAHLRIFRTFLNEEQEKLIIEEIFQKKSFLPLPFELIKIEKLKEVGEKLKLTVKEKKLLELCSKYRSESLENEIKIKEILNLARGLTSDDLIDGVRVLLNQDISVPVNKILENKIPYLISDLAVTGTELKKSGIQGKELGAVLKKLQILVWENPELNKEKLLLEIISGDSQVK